MPRRDRTYTADDIVRFVDHNLDVLERAEVIERLGGGETAGQETVEGIVAFMFSRVPILGQAFEIALLLTETFGDHPLARQNALNWAQFRDNWFSIRNNLNQIDF